MAQNIFISGQTDGAFAANTSKGKFDMFVMPLTTNGNSFLLIPSVNDNTGTTGWQTAEAGTILNST